jgi:DNA-binding protein H-NS
MAKAADLKELDVDALLALRADVERVLADKGRDLQRQIALLGGGGEIKRRGRPPKPKAAGRGSHLKGVKVPPKYRGPGGETWAGRGAPPRWLAALIKEGHSIEEFLIGRKGGKAAAASVKKVVAKKKVAKKKAAKPVRKVRRAKESGTEGEPVAA